MGALARCVGDPEEFLAGLFTRHPHLARGGSYDDLLSLADVDAQLSGAGLRRPVVRVVRGGELIDPAAWTRRARTGAVRIDDLIHPGRVLELFGDGATIVLQSLQRWWPPITRFCAELERELGHAVQTNAYLTPPGSVGFTPHHDTHDVFVLQVHGTKRWVVREPVLVDPLVVDRSDHAEAAGQTPILEVDLEPGDCLYLPRGYVHSATTTSGTSLHLTVGVLASTVHDVLVRLAAHAAKDQRFRRTVLRSMAADGTADPAQDRATLKAVVAELAGWLAHFDAQEHDDEVVQTIVGGDRRRVDSAAGHLLDLADIGALDDRSSVVRRPVDPVRTREHGDRVELDLGDRTIDLPGELRPALELLLDGDPHTVSELASMLDDSSRLVLVRRLVRDGALRTEQRGAVPFEAAPSGTVDGP